VVRDQQAPVNARADVRNATDKRCQRPRKVDIDVNYTIQQTVWHPPSQWTHPVFRSQIVAGDRLQEDIDNDFSSRSEVLGQSQKRAARIRRELYDAKTEDFGKRISSEGQLEDVSLNDEEVEKMTVEAVIYVDGVAVIQ